MNTTYQIAGLNEWNARLAEANEKIIIFSSEGTFAIPRYKLSELEDCKSSDEFFEKLKKFKAPREPKWMPIEDAIRESKWMDEQTQRYFEECFYNPLRQN